MDNTTPVSDQGSLRERYIELAATEAEARRLANAARAADDHVRQLRRGLVVVLHAGGGSGLVELTDVRVRLAVRRRPERVEVREPERLPPRFVEMVRKPKEAELRRALLVGEDVPGAELIGLDEFSLAVRVTPR